MHPDWIVPDWPAPHAVRAVVTTRNGGTSPPPFDSLNLGDHVGDDPRRVAANRTRLLNALDVPAVWLNQVHGIEVLRLRGPLATTPTADGAITRERGLACVVMTADCLPVLFCDRAGTRVGAAHAGWRGLAAGVLENTIAAMDCAPAGLMVWLGPAIGPDAFEVGAEVRAQFVAQDPAAEAAFRPTGGDGKWWCDLYQLARLRLARSGLSHVFGGGFCTYAECDRFFSYRRDGPTGRMGAFVWLAQ
jgi:YfiH family protein